jgi:hypothetical protein
MPIRNLLSLDQTEASLGVQTLPGSRGGAQALGHARAGGAPV